ncbi:MAG: Protein LemA [Phycisphaerae bacterium]|nr:Protein LemA [Phycisphaerae bacterium]
MWGWIAIAAVVLAVGWTAWTYNRFVSLRQRADGAWSDIDVQLKRRWDLVPSLVATVEGYAAHEKQTLQQVVQARNQAMQHSRATPAGGVDQRGQTEQALAAAVKGLFAVAEAYPDLKANESFRQLHKSLVEIEDTIQYARRYYNAVVRDLNTLRASFPPNLIGGLVRVQPREFFQLDARERSAPAVELP